MGNQRVARIRSRREKEVTELEMVLRQRCNRLEGGFGPVDQLPICKRRIDEYRYGSGGRGHRVYD